jgi:hypothetical protein
MRAVKKSKTNRLKTVRGTKGGRRGEVPPLPSRSHFAEVRGALPECRRDAMILQCIHSQVGATVGAVARCISCWR